ncbi:MAG: diguanylate cyclase, partial [Gaiellaceae bacterium]
ADRPFVLRLAAALVCAPRLLFAPVCGTGLMIAFAAAISLAATPHSPAELAGALVFLLASTAASRYPVANEDAERSSITLSFVFGTSGVVLFGWDAGILIAAAAPATMQLLERRPLQRVAYSGSVFAIGAAVAAALVAFVDGSGTQHLVAQVLVSAAAQYTLSLLLLSAADARAARRAFASLVESSGRATLVPLALMTSAALVLVVLWQRSPLLSLALVGPLLAISLYQRSAYRALSAMRLSLTDPLTGLPNHRAFQERIQRELGRAEARNVAVSLCLIDIDDFKRVNDLFGHPVGDSVLAQVSTRLRQNGEVFRLGGDEFALVLRARDAEETYPVAQRVLSRIAALDLGDIGRVTASAGIASVPPQALDRDELILCADRALYRAKEDGKNRVATFTRELGYSAPAPAGATP